jgi:hypothetical protein
VLICNQKVKAGAEFQVDQDSFKVTSDIDIGHKIARSFIGKGEKIIRYGAPIGSSICNIKPGDHVHIHNMKSDYIPSHTRQRKVGG